MIPYQQQVWGKEIVIIVGNFNGHLGVRAGNYEDHHGSYRFEVRNTKNEKIPETRLDYCLAGTYHRKSAEDIKKVLPSE